VRDKNANLSRGDMIAMNIEATGYVPVRIKGDGTGEYLDLLHMIYGKPIDAARIAFEHDEKAGRTPGSPYSFLRVAKVLIVEIPEPHDANM
jgi:hypothetical protein